MQSSGHEFSQLQTPIAFQWRTHPNKTSQQVDLELTVASPKDGVTVIPIMLNFCNAYDLGQALLAAAAHLKPHTPEVVNSVKEAPDEA